ncbi:MAG: ABC transporter permease subunit [Propionibacteriales bacterium]|nr:ABC transporter permease subunit [Propionibacteriales bacterium]
MLAVFLLPALALYTVFIVYPLFSALQYSLFEWTGTARQGFLGLQNFAALFTVFPYDEQLIVAFWHNCLFFIGTMAVQNTLGLLFAMLLHRRRFGKRLFQTLYTLPYMVSPIVVGYLWLLLLRPQFGALNVLFENIGFDFLARPWLGDPDTALPVVILINAWQWLGFPMLLFGAALAGIPDEYDDAARVDGATGWRAFRYVTLPLLTPAIGTVTVLTFIGNFNEFSLVYAVGGSQGNPAFSTDVLGLLFYRTAFEGGLNAIGRSSALAVLMFVFIFGIAVVANRYLRKRERELT